MGSVVGGRRLCQRVDHVAEVIGDCTYVILFPRSTASTPAQILWAQAKGCSCSGPTDQALDEPPSFEAEAGRDRYAHKTRSDPSWY